MSDSEEESSFSFVDKRRSHGGEGPDEGDTTPAAVEPSATSDGKTSEQTSEAPPVDFATFIISLYSNAVYNLGGHQDPVSGKTSFNLDLAKQNIDLIAVMQEKTKGNLTTEEERLLEHTLYDLRMKFVEAAKGDGA